MLASVIIYTYDRKEFILNAVKSVASQTLKRSDYEIIVVKGFKDDSIDSEIDRLADKNIYIHEKGHGKKLAPAIKSAQGDIIFFLDDDDEFLPTKLKTVSKYFEGDPDLNFLHNSIVKIDLTGERLEDSEEPAPKDGIVLDTRKIRSKAASKFLRYRANWYSSCMAIRRKVLLKHLSKLENVDQSVDPFIFFIALCSGGKLLLSPDRLTRYRVHSSTTNYIVPFEEYIEKRKSFYTNSSRNFIVASAVCEGSSAGKLINAMRDHMDLITSIMDINTEPSKVIGNVLRVIKTVRVAFTRYQTIWLIFAALRIFSYTAATKAYYNYYSRSFKN